MTIYSIAKITNEAVAAAKTSSNINNVCPYPFDTDAGRIYCATFEAACKIVDDNIATDAALDIARSLDQFEALPA